MRFPGAGTKCAGQALFRDGRGPGGHSGWRLRASWAGGDTAFGCDAGSVRRGRVWWNGGGGGGGWMGWREAFLLLLFAEDSQRWQQGGVGVMLLTERARAPGTGWAASEGCEWHEAWLNILRDWPERPKEWGGRCISVRRRSWRDWSGESRRRAGLGVWRRRQEDLEAFGGKGGTSLVA